MTEHTAVVAQQLLSEFSDEEASPGLMLWRVTNRWQAAQRAALKPVGLTHVQFVLLAALTWLQGGEPVTQQRLADHSRTDPMMTSQVVRTLEVAALVSREPHPHDGRAKVLTVTAAGLIAVNRAIVLVESCDRDFFATLGSDRDTLAALLARLG